MISNSESPEGCVSPLSQRHETPSTPLEHHSPNQLKYYNDHLNKSQFNLILINCALNLLKVIYSGKLIEEAKLRFFIIEVLRRSKSSIQTLQIACYYMFRVINKRASSLPSCPKKLFLGLIILASKFNQDHNYSFKSWLKICGCKTEDDSNLNLQKLRRTEVECLELLDYNLFINSSKYENWCNVLLIFGYDFITLHEVNNGVLRWSDVEESAQKLDRWNKFLVRLDDKQLKHTAVNFKEYYANQIGSKVVVSAPQKVSHLFGKRFHEDDLGSSKKSCIA